MIRHALLASVLLWPAIAAGNWLLIDSAEIEAAKARAQKYPWAKASLDRLLSSARGAMNLAVEVPDKVGQWPHWYSCKKDGARLRTVSPTEHRCPRCGTVYTGDPYDAVVVGGLHNRYSSAVRDLGLAYRFTGNADYAQRAGAILVAYAGRYRSYPRHNVNGEDRVGGGRVMAQTLDESTWLIPIAWGYALVRDRLTQAQRTHIADGLLRPAAEVIREHKMGVHNIQCWKNSAVGLVGFATGAEELVKDAIDDPQRGFRVQIEKGVTGDGLWWEGSMGYHTYTMSALWPLAEAARHAGVDLYSGRYRTLYDAPLALALPDGTAPGFNDNAGGNVLGQAPLYELAYARWKTPAFGRLVAKSERNSLHALLYGVESVPEGSLIPTTSALLESAGFAMLRDGGTTIAVRFGSHGGGHGHPDKLNVVTFGLGRLFGLDPGSIDYGVALHKEWYRSTIAHNTVSVDQQLQSNVDGKLIRFENNTLAADAGSVYPGVKLTRTIRLVRDGLAEDRFDCSSETARVYDYAFHASGRFTSSLKLETSPKPLGETNGYQHIREVTTAAAAGDWWARWENEGAALTLKVKGEAGTEVFAGSGPGRNPADSVPLVLIRRRGRATVFAVTHEFTKR
jgi:hypothetical protein